MITSRAIVMEITTTMVFVEPTIIGALTRDYIELPGCTGCLFIRGEGVGPERP
jgi:hypothetical protein